MPLPAGGWQLGAGQPASQRRGAPPTCRASGSGGMARCFASMPWKRTLQAWPTIHSACSPPPWECLCRTWPCALPRTGLARAGRPHLPTSPQAVPAWRCSLPSEGCTRPEWLLVKNRRRFVKQDLCRMMQLSYVSTPEGRPSPRQPASALYNSCWLRANRQCRALHVNYGSSSDMAVSGAV